MSLPTPICVVDTNLDPAEISVVNSEMITTSNELIWVYNDPSSILQATPEESRKITHHRRSHHKSRNGCLQCKGKRVKCDERKPKCRRCHQQGFACEFPVLKQAPNPPKTSVSTSRTGSDSLDLIKSSAIAYSITISSTAAQLVRVLGDDRPYKSSALGKVDYTHKIIETFRHFQITSYSTLGNKFIQTNFRTIGVALAQEAPYLLNAMYAFSASHIHNLKTDDVIYGKIATFYAQRAVHLYAEMLMKTPQLQNMDSMIATCLLISSLAFFTEDASPSSSWVFSERPDSLYWLQVVGGLKVVVGLECFSAHLPESIWYPIFQSPVTNPQSFRDYRPGKVGIPPDFAEICHIEEDSTIDNNPYLGPLRLLIAMLNIEPSIATFPRIIQFPCRINPKFLALLQTKDLTALLMLAYWLAQMYQIQHWWIKTRARNECHAICAYLDGKGDETFQTLLKWPMEACDYTPIDVSMIGALVFGM